MDNRTKSGIVDTVKERATAQLSNQKGRATDGLDVVAQAVRQTTQQLRDGQHDTIAQYVDRAAEQLERFSSAIRSKEVPDLLREARQLARRQPALFIGGSFAVGLLAARFLKSSRQDDDDNRDGYGTPYSGGTAYSGGTGYSGSTDASPGFATSGDQRPQRERW